MPYEIKYSDSGEGVVTIFNGIVTDEELIKSTEDRIFSGKELSVFRYAISDYTDVQEYRVTSKGIIKVASLAIKASEHNHQMLIALVMPTNTEFGMGRMWQAYTDENETGWKTKIVRSLDEAYAWIQLNN